MAKIDLTINEERLKHAVDRARERNIVIPTLEQQLHPETVPAKFQEELKSIGLWDIHPRNLFRITWHNEPVEKGGAYGGVNFIELPSSLTGVDARVIGLVGKWFPTGAHKVGAAFACLVPRLVTGQFDPTTEKAVWPSTGNYCRGGAYDSALLACKSIAILPEGMSQERFNWLKGVADEVIATPGTESNVKEIFDKCWELRKSGQELMIFNQFEEFGNYLWHYTLTGHAMQEVFEQVKGKNGRLAGIASNTGSGGTIACGDYLKQQLDSIGWPNWVNDYSNTVFFRRPSQRVISKYTLAQGYDDRFGGELAHVVVMQHVTKEKIDMFIADLIEETYNANGVQVQ